MSKIYKTTDASAIVISELMLPSYSNFSGKIHGGFILSLMDKTAFTCASKFSGHYCVTASVNTVDFLFPIEVGELVTMKAKINYVGRSSMVVGIRVESQNIRTGAVKHCNSSYFSMVAKDDQDKTVAVPGLKLVDKNDIRRFLRSVKRAEMRSLRKKEFSSNDFISENYLAQLEKHNVLVEL